MAYYPGETWRPIEYCEGWQNTKDWGDLLEISVFELDPERGEHPRPVAASGYALMTDAEVKRAFGLGEERLESAIPFETDAPKKGAK